MIKIANKVFASSQSKVVDRQHEGASQPPADGVNTSMYLYEECICCLRTADATHG